MRLVLAKMAVGAASATEFRIQNDTFYSLLRLSDLVIRCPWVGLRQLACAVQISKFYCRKLKQVCLDLAKLHQKMQAFYGNEKSALAFEVLLALNDLLMGPIFCQHANP